MVMRYLLYLFISYIIYQLFNANLNQITKYKHEHLFDHIPTILYILRQMDHLLLGAYQMHNLLLWYKFIKNHLMSTFDFDKSL